MEGDIYLMESECCDECGCALRWFETTYCTDCLTNDEREIEDDYYAGWDAYY
jgi:hypothetical protein